MSERVANTLLNSVILNSVDLVADLLENLRQNMFDGEEDYSA